MWAGCGPFHSELGVDQEFIVFERGGSLDTVKTLQQPTLTAAAAAICACRDRWPQGQATPSEQSR
jgi:hypothetical protein